jgi:hypothetical protein
MGTRKWLEQELINTYLPKLERLTNTPSGRKACKKLLETMRDDWATNHELVEPIQQQGCMDQVRASIKANLGEEHWTLAIIGFSTAEYVVINNIKQDRVSKKNEAVQAITDPEAIVSKAVRLLESNAWADITAGLAVLTGRRVAELLSTATFTKKTHWCVIFTGAVKRGSEEGLQFEIPTLTTAQKVVDALAKIRKELPQAQGMTATEINQKYESLVAKACDKHFKDLIPVREGKDNLYTHLFRGVYATIATFWYCPPNIEAREFQSAIQGHFQILNEENPQLRRSLSASRHYADYEIADKAIAQAGGKRKGIKLGHGGIAPIEMFATTPEKPVKDSQKRGRTQGSIRLWREDKPVLEGLFERLGLPLEMKQEDKVRVVINWLDQNLVYPQLVEATPEPESVVVEIAEPAPVEAVDPLRADMQSLIGMMGQFVQTSQSLLQQATTMKPPARPPETIAPAEPAEPKQRKRKERQTEIVPTIHKAIDAIIAWNSAPERIHTDRWAITINALKSWVTWGEKITEILEERKEELEAHYKQFGIDPAKHNYFHRGKNKIRDMISID